MVELLGADVVLLLGVDVRVYIPIPLLVGELSYQEFPQPFWRNRSRQRPDPVQIWSRFHGPDRLDQFRQIAMQLFLCNGAD